MTATTDLPATLDHQDAQDIARRVISDALRTMQGPVEHHGDWWEIARDNGELAVRPTRDGLLVAIEDPGTGRRVYVTVLLSALGVQP